MASDALNTGDVREPGTTRLPDPSLTPTAEQEGGYSSDADAMTAPGSKPGPALDMTPGPKINRRLVGADGSPAE
jgi:hypothetical protein